MTMARTLKLYKLPEEPQTPGLRQMQPADVPQVGRSGAGVVPAGGVSCVWRAALRSALRGLVLVRHPQPASCLLCHLQPCAPACKRLLACSEHLLCGWPTPQVTKLLNSYLQGFSIAPVLDEEEVRHWLSFQVRLGRAGTGLWASAPCSHLSLLRSLEASASVPTLPF